jgi:hypothetical protein
MGTHEHRKIGEIKMKSCANCENYVREEESWEMPHIYWYECKARPGMENLTSFPFKNTKCKSFTQKQIGSLSEILIGDKNEQRTS